MVIMVMMTRLYDDTADMKTPNPDQSDTVSKRFLRTWNVCKHLSHLHTFVHIYTFINLSHWSQLHTLSWECLRWIINVVFKKGNDNNFDNEDM